jgi:hypothetical protein
MIAHMRTDSLDEMWDWEPPTPGMFHFSRSEARAVYAVIATIVVINKLIVGDHNLGWLVLALIAAAVGVVGVWVKRWIAPAKWSPYSDWS